MAGSNASVAFPQPGGHRFRLMPVQSSHHGTHLDYGGEHKSCPRKEFLRDVPLAFSIYGRCCCCRRRIRQSAYDMASRDARSVASPWLDHYLNRDLACARLPRCRQTWPASWPNASFASRQLAIRIWGSETVVRICHANAAIVQRSGWLLLLIAIVRYATGIYSS